MAEIGINLCEPISTNLTECNPVAIIDSGWNRLQLRVNQGSNMAVMPASCNQNKESPTLHVPVFSILDKSCFCLIPLSSFLSLSSGAYHPYHITKAYPVRALCCTTKTFCWPLFIAFLWLCSFHKTLYYFSFTFHELLISFSLPHRIFILLFIAGWPLFISCPFHHTCHVMSMSMSVVKSH